MHWICNAIVSAEPTTCLYGTFPALDAPAEVKRLIVNRRSPANWQEKSALTILTFIASFWFTARHKAGKTLCKAGTVESGVVQLAAQVEATGTLSWRDLLKALDGKPHFLCITIGTWAKIRGGKSVKGHGRSSAVVENSVHHFAALAFERLKAIPHDVLRRRVALPPIIDVSASSSSNGDAHDEESPMDETIDLGESDDE